MRSKKEGYKRHIRRRSRRRKLIRLSVSLFAYVVKIILTALVVLFLMKASAAPEKEAAGQQAQASEAAVSYKAARQQATPQKGNDQAAGPSFVPLDVPMTEEDQKEIFDICNDYKIAYTLVMAMIEHESDFDASARSKTGDSGLMQIHDCNSARLAEMGFKDLFDTRENVEAGVYMLRELFDKYGEVKAVLMCYNMGEAGAAELWDAGIFSSAYSSEIMAREAEFSSYIDNFITNN